MSAIALHDILEDFEPAAAGPAPRRRDHLRVVRPGETAPAVHAQAEGRLTITRRGRLAVTLSVATLLVLTVGAAAGLLPAAADGGEMIVVQPGQTLSQIAVTHLPDLPMDRAIMELQLANNLNSLDVQAGIELQIPGR